MPFVARRPPCRACSGLPEIGGLVAEHQQARGLALAQVTIEGDRFGDRCDTEDAALFGRFNDIGPHPLAINP